MDWLIFFGLIVGLLFLDFKVLNNKPHAIGLKEAAGQSLFWIGLGCAFGGYVYLTHGHDAGNQYFMAYILEKSLSVDNLVVFVSVFAYFNVPEQFRHKVLYWGIIGAIVLRAICIVGGVQLMHSFHWLTYVFGAILLVTAWKVAMSDDDSPEAFDETPFAKWIHKTFKVCTTDDMTSGKFFVDWKNQYGKGVQLSMLGFVLCIIEFTDLVFATDSIPAALACSNDAFVIYTSNIFAVLGLRSLFFALQALADKFYYLKYGVAVVLAFVGLKMLTSSVFPIDTALSLTIVGSTLIASIVASIVNPPKIATP